MTILEAIQNRHSVRSYLDRKIPNDIAEQLQKEIKICNQESGLHIQLVTNEPKAFDSLMAHYGERIVLLAQALGLNTCWVAMTVSKGAVKSNIKINAGEKLGIVISLGYGTTQGIPHKSKAIDALCRASEKPEWFVAGMKAAMLAPTAMNQQKFLITLDGDKVFAKSLGGFYSKVDLGIVKYHFEVGAGTENFRWA